MNPDLIVPASPVEPVPRVALQPREAAQAVGVSERTMSAWLNDGTIPSVKLGRCRLVPVDVLRQWLAEQANGND